MSLRVETTLRLPTKADVPFITRAWVKASTTHNEHYRRIAAPVACHHTHVGIHTLLRAPAATWLVASWPQDSNFAYGFLAGEATTVGPVVHWVYVRRHMRRLGVGEHLLRSFMEGQDIRKGYASHATPLGWRLLDATYPTARADWVYDPFLFWGRCGSITE